MRKETDRNYGEFRANVQKEAGGLVRLRGAFLKDHNEEIVNLIKHESKLAESENPDHRVTEISKVDGGMDVLISASSLAMHIGKSLSMAYKGEHKYNFSHDEKYVEVDWKRD
ncbi:MAG: chaperone ATPase [Candidatus Saganbacteria bacterium]|uniref:Chaperone ATPase n=1 Tax=Candidatus Saganbacteria bacterium TaxID=2575572 RepID=A0A833L1A7_UNCSA|nr:MAG: chaperone ATPase [Candidatus Saganbacteria bacterium]